MLVAQLSGWQRQSVNRPKYLSDGDEGFLYRRSWSPEHFGDPLTFPLALT